MLPIYAIFVQKIGGDILDAGYAMGIFMITQGLFTMLVHRVRWKDTQRTWMLGGGWLIWVGGVVTYLFISSVFVLFLTQIIMAIGSAIADPVFDEELVTHTDKKSEELEWGLFEGSKDLVEGLAAIMGALIVKFFGFEVLIYTMIASATVSWIGIMVYIKMLRLSNLRLKKVL